MLRGGLSYGLAVLFTIVVGAMLVGQFFGVPVAVSYVETDSMAGTIDAGDGYIAVPAEVARPVEEGDVITFDAQQLHGGGLTTHRVVEVTDQGYVTKGDANPFTDQDGDEPLVTDGQVVAKALQVDGSVVTIPYLGTAVTAIGSTLEWVQFRLASLFGTRALLGTQGIAYLFFGVGGLVLLSGLFGDRGRNAERTTQREPARKNIYDGRALVLVLFALLVAVTAGTMLVASGSNETGIVSAEFESDRADVIPNGETKNHLITVGNDGILPMVVMLEPASEGVGLNDSVHYLKRGEQTNITVSYTAPPETGYYVRSFDEYRYFGILPTSIIQSLHSIHPWIALFAVTMFLVTPLGIGIRLLLGTGRIRTRTRQRNTPHKLR